MVLKSIVSTLANGLRMHHEDDLVVFINACVILQNLFISAGDDGKDFLAFDDEVNDKIIVDETDDEKRSRASFLYYSINKQCEKK